MWIITQRSGGKRTKFNHIIVDFILLSIHLTGVSDGLGSLILELSNLCNLFPLEFKMTSGDQILSLISMKRSPNWLLKGGVSAGE